MVLGNLVIDDVREVALGRLGYPETDVRSRQDFDAARHEFVERIVEVPDARSGGFVLRYETGAIAFEADQIGPTGFLNHFVALLNATGRGSFRGELARVAETYRQFISTVDKVTKVAFEVRPTNPRDRLVFKPLDEGMKAANARRQVVTIENKDEGLVVDPPESRDEPSINPAVMGIEMNEEGYGEGYRIDGEKSGTPVRFDSRSGGGLLRDVVEDGPDDVAGRLGALEDFLDRRVSEIETDGGAAQPLDVPADADQSALSDDGDGWLTVEE